MSAWASTCAYDIRIRASLKWRRSEASGQTAALKRNFTVIAELRTLLAFAHLFLCLPQVFTIDTIWIRAVRAGNCHSSLSFTIKIIGHLVTP